MAPAKIPAVNAPNQITPITAKLVANIAGRNNKILVLNGNYCENHGVIMPLRIICLIAALILSNFNRLYLLNNSNNLLDVGIF